MRWPKNRELLGFWSGTNPEEDATETGGLSAPRPILALHSGTHASSLPVVPGRLPGRPAPESPGASLAPSGISGIVRCTRSYCPSRSHDWCGGRHSRCIPRQTHLRQDRYRLTSCCLPRGGEPPALATNGSASSVLPPARGENLCLMISHEKGEDESQGWSGQYGGPLESIGQGEV